MQSRLRAAMRASFGLVARMRRDGERPLYRACLFVPLNFKMIAQSRALPRLHRSRDVREEHCSRSGTGILATCSVYICSMDPTVSSRMITPEAWHGIQLWL